MTQTMKSTLRFATATALLALSLGAASAGDLSNGGPGGLKGGHGGAVPVPVPVPYEETYKYYLSLGAGWTFNSSGDMAIKADHQMSGQYATWMENYSQLQGPHVVSVVAGRYITPSLRAELGIDYRSGQRPAKSSHVINYNGHVKGTATDLFTGNQVAQTNVYSIRRTEDVITQNHTFMLNAYYEMNHGGRLRPHIGAGIGLSRRDVTRTTTEEVRSCLDAQSTAGLCQYNDSNLEAPGTIRNNHEERTGWGFAGALMAGATYSVSARTHLDVGYRMMYHGGKVAVVSPSLGGFSSLDIGARLDHEIRTSLRFDIW